MENAAGDWFLLDQEMDKALKSSGYDFQFRVINGGHVAGYYDQYREAMAYLWKGWPEPVRAGPGAPRVRDLTLPDEPWQRLVDSKPGVRAAAGNARGDVCFVDEAANKILRIGLDGHLAEFAADAGHANGLSFGPKSELYAVSAETGRVTSYDEAGRSTPVVDGLKGHQILAMPDGDLFLTAEGEASGAPGEVWHVKQGRKTRVDTGLKFPTGLAYRPDRWLLSVADGSSKWAYSYQIRPDGNLANKERFTWLHVPDDEDDAGAGAACYAREGQLLIATRSGVQACADDGPTQAILPLPDRARVRALAFGGPDLTTLYAFGEAGIWRRKLKIHGVGAFTPWTAVRASPL